MNTTIGRTRITLTKGDITEQAVDAIVNAANSTLMGGGGVDGAIHRKGGPSIKEECRRIRETEWPDGLPTGKAVITGAGRLPARHVIHTVGPVWRGGTRGEPELLADAYRNSLEVAREHGLKTIAFPSISTGAYGYPVAEAARVAIDTVVEVLGENDDFAEIRFVLFSEGDLQAYSESLPRDERQS